MKEIQMVDLKSQYDKIKGEIDSSIQEVINSCQFINGSKVKAFSDNAEKYLDVKHFIPCANGTDALQIAMMALGLKPGDEVITADFTFIATVEVIALLGLKPVLVDVDKDTFLVDIESLKAAITPKTKAIVPVHLFGQCANMEEILAIAKDNDLFVIEDSAQAFGSDYTFSNGDVKKAGTMGHFGCTSFFPSKNLGCYGDGGALYTNDDELADMARMIVNHGMKKRYYHEVIGVNSRLDSVQAAVLDVKLNYIDEYNSRRRDAAEFYNRELADIEYIQTPVKSGNSSHIYHQYTMLITDGHRDGLRDYLSTKNIPAMIYYPVPLHVQKAFDYNEPEAEAKFVNTNTISDLVLSLPMHTELTNEQLDYIVTEIKNYFKE